MNVSKLPNDEPELSGNVKSGYISCRIFTKLRELSAKLASNTSTLRALAIHLVWRIHCYGGVARVSGALVRIPRVQPECLSY